MQKKNKGDAFQHEFYKCLTCKYNLYPLCKNGHDRKHNIIDYEQINFICSKHNEIFFKYCEDCKSNICMLCEEEHQEHDTISLTSLLPKIGEIKNRFTEIKSE